MNGLLDILNSTEDKTLSLLKLPLQHPLSDMSVPRQRGFIWYLLKHPRCNGHAPIRRLYWGQELTNGTPTFAAALITKLVMTIAEINPGEINPKFFIIQISQEI